MMFIEIIKSNVLANIGNHAPFSYYTKFAITEFLESDISLIMINE